MGGAETRLRNRRSSAEVFGHLPMELGDEIGADQGAMAVGPRDGGGQGRLDLRHHPREEDIALATEPVGETDGGEIDLGRLGPCVGGIYGGRNRGRLDDAERLFTDRCHGAVASYGVCH